MAVVDLRQAYEAIGAGIIVGLRTEFFRHESGNGRHTMAPVSEQIGQLSGHGNGMVGFRLLHLDQSPVDCQ